MAKNPTGVDGKPPRGPLLSDWVGKVLGKPSVEPPGNSDDPVTIPIEEEDDAVESGQTGKHDDNNVDVSDKVALLESQIAHLKRAPFQTSVLSALVEQLESELSAALVERRESWPLWRQARRHQRQIDDSKKKLAKLEERELEVLGKLESLHQESCAIHESKQKLRDKIEALEVELAKAASESEVRHSQDDDKPTWKHYVRMAMESASSPAEFQRMCWNVAGVPMPAMPPENTNMVDTAGTRAREIDDDDDAAELEVKRRRSLSLQRESLGSGGSSASGTLTPGEHIAGEEQCGKSRV